MRKSSQVLVEALGKERQNPAIKKITERAKNDYYNDYFGVPAMPQHRLISDLKRARASRAIISRVINGDFEGTKEESDEWAKSAEGQEAFAELLKHHNKRV